MSGDRNAGLTQLTYLPPDTHASHSPLPDFGPERMMIATSGQRLLKSSQSSDPAGVFLRTLLVMSPWGSSLCSLAWRERATPAGRSLFQLRLSVPHREEIESGSSPEATMRFWPTPNASEHRGCGNWNTKTCKEWKDRSRLTGAVLLNEQKDGMKLSAAWVTRLMGYPDGWLDIDHP